MPTVFPDPAWDEQLKAIREKCFDYDSEGKRTRRNGYQLTVAERRFLAKHAGQKISRKKQAKTK